MNAAFPGKKIPIKLLGYVFELSDKKGFKAVIRILDVENQVFESIENPKIFKTAIEAQRCVEDALPEFQRDLGIMSSDEKIQILLH